MRDVGELIRLNRPRRGTKRSQLLHYGFVWYSYAVWSPALRYPVRVVGQLAPTAGAAP